MRYLAILLAALTLAACETPVGVNAPGAALMKKPRALPPLPKDADGRVLYNEYVNARRACGQKDDQIEGLQDYVRIISK